ncbi:TPA: hypothetical protein QCH98_004390 [Enterobacter bugandensis]|nr:hypothetical protein [Enterobacter bugandensis]
MIIKSRLIFRYLFFITILFLIFYMAFVFFRTPPLKQDDFCYASVNNLTHTQFGTVKYTLHHKIKLFKNGKGFDNFHGKFFYQDKEYVISRTVNFSYTEAKHSPFYVVMINSTHVYSTDNIPEQLISRNITFLKEGVERNVSFQSLGNANILVSDSSGPSFICNYR